MEKKIFLADHIITMAKETKPEAILSIDGRIACAGARDDVLEQAGEGAEVFDFTRATILPGFIDSHSHICAYANRLALADLTKAACFDDIVSILREFKRTHNVAPGQWIIGFGYDNNFLKEKRHPDKNLLDQVSQENPVLVNHISGHMGALNTPALQETGAPGDGYLEETEFMRYCAKVPAPDDSQMQNLMQQAQQVYLSYGITTAQEGIAKEREVKLLQEAPLSIDVVAYVDMKNTKQAYDRGGIYKTRYKDHLRLGGYKIFLDGSPQGKTAWMSKPYEGEKSYAGYGTYQDAEVTAFFETALRENVQILVHCNGDAACEQFIRCLRRACEKTGLPIRNRPVMIHAQTVAEKQLASLKELNCIVSFFNAHTYFWGDIHAKNLGARAERISPMQTAQALGLCYTLHQDTPVIEPDMLLSVWCALTRQTRQGRVLGAQECIGVYDALRAVTTNGAYQYFEEHDKGTIENGKRCDLAVLAQNPLTAGTDEIKDISVLATIKDGKVLYRRKER